MLRSSTALAPLHLVSNHSINQSLMRGKERYLKDYKVVLTEFFNPASLTQRFQNPWKLSRVRITLWTQKGPNTLLRSDGLQGERQVAFDVAFTKRKHNCSIMTATQAHISSHLRRGEQCTQALGGQIFQWKVEICDCKDRNVTEKGTMKRLKQ